MLLGLWCFATCKLYDYHFFKTKKDWSEAQNHCRKKYTDLATVSNMTDMDRLFEPKKRKMGEEAWIGLSNQTDGIRSWHWSLPGMEFNENNANWDQSHKEPNDVGTENCGFINRDLTWGDLSCVTPEFFICYNGENSLPDV